MLHSSTRSSGRHQSFFFTPYTTQKMFPADLVTFTEEILNGKLHFLCSEIFEPIVSTKPIKTSENDHSFYNTVLLKKPHAHILLTSTHLILKITCSQNKAKNLSHFTDFPANIILFGVRKNICTAPLLGAQELHSWSTLKANVFIFLYIFLREILFQIRKILSRGTRVVGGGWIISLRRLAVWAS